MKNIYYLIIISIFGAVPSIGQTYLTPTHAFKHELDSSKAQNIIAQLDRLSGEILGLELTDTYLTKSQAELTSVVLNRYVISPLKEQKIQLPFYKIQLMNLYKVGKGVYKVSLAIVDTKRAEIQYLIELVAESTVDKYTFSTPTYLYTTHWKQQRIGNITYHFRDSINVSRAEIFDEKNTVIANKMGLEPDTFDVYMCYNEQEVLKLLGIDYCIDRNGQTRNGFGVYTSTICSIMNHEDFSHDVFHYYSEKINRNENRNWVTEEGVAYLWGNAYYTNITTGEMIEQEELTNELRNYIQANPEVSLYELFENNTKIFNHLAPEVSVRSTIAGLIVQMVEMKYGMEGVQKLINSGSVDQFNSFMGVLNELTGLNSDNFDKKIIEMLQS